MGTVALSVAPTRGLQVLEGLCCMREPPIDLPDRALAASLRTHYGIADAEITFLPLGYDSSAWVYRARAAGGVPYFLKVRKSVTNAPGLLVPRYLRDHGGARVVAPLATAAGTLWAALDGYALILYPFVAGATGMVQGMTPPQWIAYGASLRQIHATTLPPDLAQSMQRETFVPVGAGMIRDLETHMGSTSVAGPEARALAAFWQQRRDVIRTLTERAEELGRRLSRTAPAFVLCHADIHTNNVLLDVDGQLWIVDWDDTVLAPRERDLMFAVGGGISREFVGPRDEELFLQGYGATTIDPLALAYYRHAWAVGDIGAYGEEVFVRPDLGPVSKRAALDKFRSLFLPGSIVELALASDGHAA